jgi:hypothetical protein
MPNHAIPLSNYLKIKANKNKLETVKQSNPFIYRESLFPPISICAIGSNHGHRWAA